MRLPYNRYGWNVLCLIFFLECFIRFGNRSINYNFLCIGMHNAHELITIFSSIQVSIHVLFRLLNSGVVN